MVNVCEVWALYFDIYLLGGILYLIWDKIGRVLFYEEVAVSG